MKGRHTDAGPCLASRSHQTSNTIVLVNILYRIAPKSYSLPRLLNQTEIISTVILKHCLTSVDRKRML